MIDQFAQRCNTKWVKFSDYFQGCMSGIYPRLERNRQRRTQKMDLLSFYSFMEVIPPRYLISHGIPTNLGSYALSPRIILCR